MELLHLPCYCGTLRQVSRTLTQFYDEALRPSGIRVTQYAILQVVHELPDIRVAELGHALGMDDTTVTRSVTVLHRDGWLLRKTAKDDKRAKCIRLTAEGSRRFEAAATLWNRAQIGVEQILGAQGAIEVQDMAYKLAQGLQGRVAPQQDSIKRFV